MRKDAKITTLMDVYYEIFSFDSNCVGKVFIDHRHQLLDSFLCERFRNDHRAVHHSGNEVQIESPDRLAVFENCVALAGRRANLAFKVKLRHEAYCLI